LTVRIICKDDALHFIYGTKLHHYNTSMFCSMSLRLLGMKCNSHHVSFFQAEDISLEKRGGNIYDVVCFKLEMRNKVQYPSQCIFFKRRCISGERWVIPITLQFLKTEINLWRNGGSRSGFLGLSCLPLFRILEPCFVSSALSHPKPCFVSSALGQN
jgi:hypothetical protein